MSKLLGHDTDATKLQEVHLKSNSLKVVGTHDAEMNTSLNNIESTLNTHSGYIDGLEASNSSIDTRLANSINAGTTTYGEAQGGRLNVYAYGRDAANATMKPLKLDASGRLECSVDALEVTAETINLSTDQLEALIGNTNTALGTIDSVLDASLVKITNNETLITATNSKLDVIDTVLDASLVKQTNLETLITALDTVQDNALTKLGEIETSANALIAANHTDLGVLEASLVSMEGKIDVVDSVLDASLVKHTAVETLLTALDTVQDNALLKLTGIDEDTNLIKGHVDGIETLIGTTNSLLGTADAVLDASLVKQTNLETLITALDTVQDNALLKLTGIDEDTNLIKGHVDGIETLIGSTNALITTSNSGLSSIDSGITDIDGLISDNKDLLTTIDSDTDNIKTATELVATAVDTNSSNATAVRSDVYFQGVASETNSGNKNDNCQRVVLATDDVPTALTNTILSTIDGRVDGLETLVGTTNSLIGTADAVLDASLVKQTNLETLITQLDVVADASLVKQTNLETLLTAQSAKLPASLGAKTTANSMSTCRSSTAGAYDMSARTTIGTASTTTKLLCDAQGHLQVDVLSGGGSTDVSALSTHAKQDTIIGHLDGVEGKLDHLSDNIDTLDAVQDNALTKLGEIETSADAILAKNTEIETTADAILAKNTEIETTADAILAKNTEIETTADAILAKNTQLETLLTSIAPRTATGTLSDAVNLVDGGATSIVDTDGYRYMTVFGKATNDFSLTVQYSLTNSASKMVSLYLQDFGTNSVNSINVCHAVLEHPARYVRLINYNGSQANALTLYYQLSN